MRDVTVRSGLSRTTTDVRIDTIRRAFRWAASVELLPVEVHQRLATVEGLAAGRTDVTTRYAERSFERARQVMRELGWPGERESGIDPREVALRHGHAWAAPADIAPRLP